jgi:hypothetical protein
LGAGKLHIFTAIRAEAAAIRPVVPDGAVLTVIGIRAVRLPVQVDASAIIMAGFAGALDPSLRIGDVVYDTPPRGPSGSIHTSGELVATVQEKALLFRSTSARAVDMENAIVRQFAGRMGVPFFGIRAISDTADEAIDPRILRFVDERGRLRPAALAGGLLRRPALIPALNRLRINSNIAGRSLAEALRFFLEQNRELFA